MVFVPADIQQVLSGADPPFSRALLFVPQSTGLEYGSSLTDGGFVAEERTPAEGPIQFLLQEKIVQVTGKHMLV